MEQSNPHRFAKDNRLLDAASFSRVFDKATRSRDRWFTVLWRPNNMKLARLGLAISKKKARKASARNRIKRVVRESFRRHKEELRGLDIVVMNNGLAAEAPNNVLFESLTAHWKRCEKANVGGKE